MSSPIQKYIAKKKKQKKVDSLDVNQFIVDQAKEMTDKMLKELRPKLLAETKEIIQNSINNLVRDVKKGDPGYTPRKGVDYFDGRDGKTPKKGVDYFDGKDGKDGKTPIAGVDFPIPKDGESIIGPPGKDGSPDKPIQIATKLNTLEEKIELKVIKGLEDRFQNIQTNMRNIQSDKVKQLGGGGVGNFIPETFALTSATTTVTLSYNVANNGKFILVSYQGQLVSPNDTNGYSINGKIITLGFTPVNGTYLDVWYVRT